MIHRYIRHLAKCLLGIKIAICSICISKFFDRISTYAVKIFRQHHCKISNLINHSACCSKFIIFIGCFLWSLSSTVCCEIYQLRLGVSEMTCDWCTREVRNTLRTIPHIENISVFPHADLVGMEWKKNEPFQSKLIFDAFANSRFTAYDLHIDFQGIFHEAEEFGLITMDNGSKFHITYLSRPFIHALREGDSVQVRGIVTNRGGKNYLLIRRIVLETPAENLRPPQFPPSATFSSAL